MTGAVALYLTVVLPVALLLCAPRLGMSPPALALAVTVLLAPVGWYWWREPAPATADTDRHGGWRVVALLTLLGLGLRLVGLERYPQLMDHDAGLNAAMAMTLDGQPYTAFTSSIGVGTETPFMYLLLGLFKLLGVSVWTLRFAGVLVGTLTLVALFVFARELFGRRVALVAVALAAISPWANLMSRSSKHSLLVPPVLCLTFAALMAALRRGRWWLYLLAGIGAGASLYTYAAYRHGLPVAVLFALLFWRTRRKTEDAPRGFGLGVVMLALGVGLTLTPLVLHWQVHGGEWWEPLSQNTSLTEVRHGGFGVVLRGAAEVLYTALWVRPTEGVAPGLFLNLLLVGALPLLLRLRDRRMFLLAWLAVWMILPPMGARYELGAPRRYVGLFAVIFTIQALVLVLLHDRLDGIRRRVFVGWVGLCALGLVIGGGVQIAQPPGPDDVEAKRENVLRAAMTLASGDGYDVYLPAGYHQHGYFSLRFFFLHPRVHELPHNDLFGVVTGERDVVLFAEGTRLGDWVQGAFSPDARGVEIALPYPDRAATTRAVKIPAAALRAARQPGPQGSGQLYVPHDGLYRLRVEAGAAGALWLGDALAMRAAGGGETVEVALSRGLMPYRIEARKGSPPWRLSWRRLRTREATPALDRCCWQVRSPGPFRAPALGWLPGTFRMGGGIELAEGLAQDLVRHDDTTYLATLFGVVRFDKEGRYDREWRLTDPAGEPVGFDYQYRILPDKLWSLSVGADAKVLLSQRPGRWVRQFGADGKQHLELLPPAGAWGDPVDVASAADGRLAVADRDMGGVVVFDAQGRHLTTHATGDPVSVAWLGADLVVLDASELSLLRIAADGTRRSVFVGRVDGSSRVAASPKGRLIVCNRRTLRLFDADLRLLAPDGDAAVLDRRPEPSDTLAAVWDDALGRVWALADGLVHEYAFVPRPSPPMPPGPASIDIAATAVTSGNVMVRPTRTFGAGLAIDGGQWPAFAEYAVRIPTAGRYQVWVRYATEDPRPFVVALGTASVRTDSHNSGGYTRDHLRWEPLGIVKLGAGPATLRLAADRLFPHVARIQLVPVE